MTFFLVHVFVCEQERKEKSFRFPNLFYASSFGNKWKSIKDSLSLEIVLCEKKDVNEKEIFITINACVHIY